MSATPRPRLRLRREQRLRAGRDFVRLKEEGRRQVQGCLILNWELAVGPEVTSRVGVVTSKSIGGAVVRNRARRLLRETFRRHQWDFRQPVTAILVARRSIAGKTYSQVEKDFLIALRLARLVGDSAPTPPTPG